MNFGVVFNVHKAKDRNQDKKPYYNEINPVYKEKWFVDSLTTIVMKLNTCARVTVGVSKVRCYILLET